MDNNDFSLKYICPINPINKNLSPYKEEPNYQLNAFINRENLPNMQNAPYFNNQLSCFATPKKEYHSFDPEIILSPFVFNSKQDITNMNLLSFRKSSINDMSPFKPMISPYFNPRIIDKT